MNQLNCVFCGRDFQHRNPKAKYCSRKCTKDQLKHNYRSLNPRPVYEVTTGTTGAINELRVATDLLSKGHHVFRSLSPNCPCDLAILKNNRLLKVEVTTGAYSIAGKITWPVKDKSKFDILAVVLHDSIRYVPPVDVSILPE